MAIGTNKRHPALPDVPTSAEAGLPNFQAAPFYAMFAPKGTPQDVLDKLADALDKGLDEETVRKRLIDLGAEIAEKKDRGPEAARCAGEERDGAADADPDGGDGEVALVHCQTLHVMPGLVPGIHAFLYHEQDVGCRGKPGHDER